MKITPLHLIAVAAGGILLGFTGGLALAGELMQNIIPTLGFVASALLLGVLVVATAWLGLTTWRGSAGIAHLNKKWTFAFLGALGLTFVVATIVQDWFIGAYVREAAFMSALPEGSLLVEGGLVSWVYFAVIAAIAVPLLWNIVPEKWQTVWSWEPKTTRPAPKVLRLRPERTEDRLTSSSGVMDEEETAGFLHGHFATGRG